MVSFLVLCTDLLLKVRFWLIKPSSWTWTLRPWYCCPLNIFLNGWVERIILRHFYYLHFLSKHSFMLKSWWWWWVAHVKILSGGLFGRGLRLGPIVIFLFLFKMNSSPSRYLKQYLPLLMRDNITSVHHGSVTAPDTAVSAVWDCVMCLWKIKLQDCPNSLRLFPVKFFTCSILWTF